MPRRLYIWLVATSVATIIVVGGALAQPTERVAFTSRPTAQAFVAREEALLTSSTEFSRADGLSKRIVARGPITATFSGDFSGAPVELRVSSGGEAFAPGAARFEPLGDLRSFSYVFGTAGQRRGGCVRVAVNWRSPTGEQVTLDQAALALTYRRDTKESCK